MAGGDGRGGEALRLFCFPPAGGSATAFEGWAIELPEWVDIWPLQFPGRQSRAGEPPFTRLEPLVELLTDEMIPAIREPFALFGHSMGALVAFEVARALRRTGAPSPRAIYVSGFRAPHLPDGRPQIHALPEDALLRELAAVDSIFLPLLQDDTARRRLWLPTLRADIEACETYRHVHEEPLLCAVRVFGGRDDRSVRPPELRSWRRHTLGPFRIEMFPGDHSFPMTARSEMLRVLRDDLCEILADARNVTAHAGYAQPDPGRLELVTDRPRSRGRPVRAGQVAFTLPDETTAALEGLCASTGHPLSVALLAAYATVLGRFAEQEAIVVGVPAPASSDWLIQPIEVPPDLRFRELMRTVAARRYRPSTVERVAIGFRLGDGADGHPPELDLRVHIDAGVVKGHLRYDAGIHAAATVARLTESYLELLRAIPADPDARLGLLPLLSDEERRQVFVEWNDTSRSNDGEPDVLTRFNAIAAAEPTAVAFRDAKGDLTYDALGRRANQLAHHLAGLGVGPEVPVGVAIERSCDIPVILLAVWKAGGAWLPLDPSYPPDRLRFMLDDARAPVLVTTSRLARLFGEETLRRTVCLDVDAAAIGRCPTTDLGSGLRPNQLASITYTSGSTGRPKGVAVEHRQILNRLVWMWQAYPFGPDEVGAQITPTSFVDSLWELLGPLLCGIPTIVVAQEQLSGLTGLVDTLASSGVTRLWTVPSFLRALLDAHPDLAQRLPLLRFWVSTGEPLPVALYERFVREMPHGTLYNLYGTSEVWDATWHDPSIGPEPCRSVPIGRPIRNVHIYVLDSRQQPVPPGVAGELYVGGLGLARGYVGRPDLTAECFVPHPFDPTAGARLYRTGDRARHLPDGTLELLGRRDDQFNVRGFRIERGEIEAHVRQHPAVREVAVTLTQGGSGDSRLVAYVVAAHGRAVDSEEIRAYLVERLPRAGVPNAFVVLEALPLTPSGKIDYRSLQHQQPVNSSAAPTDDAPATALERVVADLWCEVFSEARIGLHDDFFQLGGDSLLAAGMVSRLRGIFGVEMPLGRFFDAPTVAGLVAMLTADPGSRDRVHATADRLSIERQDVR